YKAKGRWMEDDAYRPDIGDILMYCWKDGDNYATTDQTANPNHVGFVGAVNSNTMTIYEGNKGEAVATRTVPINGRYIRGYCLPDYASKATTIKTEAEEDDDMDISKLTDADIEALAARLDTVLSKKEPSDWSKEARIWAEGQNIISGDQAGNKKYKKPATREELVQILYNIENPS
ncbi:MAG: CHAP domain-containing protein, partial [Flavonifractor plautii]